MTTRAISRTLSGGESGIWPRSGAGIMPVFVTGSADAAGDAEPDDAEPLARGRAGVPATSTARHRLGNLRILLSIGGTEIMHFSRPRPMRLAMLLRFQMRPIL